MEKPVSKKEKAVNVEEAGVNETYESILHILWDRVIYYQDNLNNLINLLYKDGIIKEPFSPEALDDLALKDALVLIVGSLDMTTEKLVRVKEQLQKELGSVRIL